MISVVIPAFNEKDAIDQTVRQAGAVLGEVDHEVIVVDDGSDDGTGELAAEAGARVIRHPHNRGYGLALKDGIEAAHYDTIVIVDADGTYPLEAIPSLLEEYHKGFHMVVGARTGDPYRESWLKTPLRRALKWLVEFTVGRKIPDVNSGLRVFSRKEILPYFNTLCNTFSFTTSLTLAYMMTYKYIGYVPIAYRERQGETKVRLFRDSLRTLQYIVQSILYYNPIKLFLILSGFALAFGTACLVLAWSSFSSVAIALGAGSVLVGILLFGMGLVCDLLRQIMQSGRK